ncbi:MAG: PBSX family phage terminase large subunit [Oleiphilaceae bacterium]|nr:PBSX family phage terminase large subunit [Oleiphilaceae bacterium]
MQVQINEKLLPLLNIPKRFKIVIGGRGSGKSQGVGDILLVKGQASPMKAGCFREFQNSIQDSVQGLLKEEIERLALPGYKTTRDEIEGANGTVFKFKGLARNPDSVKSMHGFNFFWVEEAQSISEESLKLLTPTLRTEGGEIWFTANPMSSADPFSQRFIVPFQAALLKDGYYEDDLHLIIVLNWRDNPWFPEELNKERLWDYANLPRNLYNHIWEGHFNDSVENSIIPAEWFEAAIDAHLKLGFKPKGQKVVAHDPSDLGEDAKGLVFRHGSVILDAQELEQGDVNDGCDWATDYAIQKGADVFVWDGDGLGVSLKRQVSESFDGKKIEYAMFKGSEGVDYPDQIYMSDPKSTDVNRTNKDTFKNKRAQYYWALRDRFFNTYLAVEKGQYIDPDEMISLSSDIPNIEKLRSEVCRIPKHPNGNGLIQILNKEQMKKLKIPSPNMADSLMMSMRAHHTKKTWQPLNYPKVSIV